MIHVFGHGESAPDEAFHGESINCDAPEAETARVLYHRDTRLFGGGYRPGGFCPRCGKNYAPRHAEIPSA